jgi:hypothetical protein
MFRIFLVLLLVPFRFFSQEFPAGWIGVYAGEMHILTGTKKSAVDVSLEIREKVKDSAWTYKMTYQAPSGEVVKDYQIIKTTDSEYYMDEGGIKIAMKYVEHTFMDYYQVDSTYFTSILRKTDKNTITFDLYGGSMKEKNKLTTNIDDFFVHAYVPSFVQSVKLKRKRK